jgi:prevent-host-death family protein
MKSVSIQELKRNLSGYLELAASGESILITRHRRAVAKLSGAEDANVRVGKRVGKGSLKPLFRNATGGAALEALLEDRYGSKGR